MATIDDTDHFTALLHYQCSKQTVEELYHWGLAPPEYAEQSQLNVVTSIGAEGIVSSIIQGTPR